MKDLLSRLWFWLRWRSHGFRVGRFALTVHAGWVEVVASWRHTDYPPQTVGERGVW